MSDPKKHRIGWFDEKHDTRGHGDWLETGEEAERVKDAVKTDHPEWKVFIFPPVEPQQKKRR